MAANAEAGSVKDLRKQLKQLEVKLATVNSINSALQGENEDLRNQLLQDAKAASTDSELAELQEEFTRRLGAADRAIAELKEERDKWKTQQQQTVAAKSAVEDQLSENLKELEAMRAEGERLSKANGDLEASLRKLRTSSRDVEGERNGLLSKISTLESQLNTIQERESRKVTESTQQIEALRQELETVQFSLKQNVMEAKQKAQEDVAAAEVKARDDITQAESSAREREDMLVSRLQELRISWESSARAWEVKEAGMKKEMLRLENHILQLEGEKAEFQASSNDYMKPLLKQIESMQAAAVAEQETASEATSALKSALQATQEEVVALQTQVQELTLRAQGAEKIAETKSRNLSRLELRAAELEKGLTTAQQELTYLEKKNNTNMRELSAVKTSLEAQKKESDVAQRGLQEKLKSTEVQLDMLIIERDELLKQIQNQMDIVREAQAQRSEAAAKPQPNQTFLNGMNTTDKHKASTTKDINSEFEELFRVPFMAVSLDPASEGEGKAVGRIQNQLATIKQQLLAVERERDRTAEELCSVEQRAKAAEDKVQSMAIWKTKLRELEDRHNVALELLGERNERVNQLEDDIVDMKHIFHEQLEECVQQLCQAREEIQRLQSQ